MIAVYPAIFHKEDESFWVEFPDLEGCQTYGDSLEETMELASEALGLYLVSKIENNETYNKASDIKKLNCENGFVSYVSCNVNNYRRKNKAVKKTLSIPEWLNEMALENNINFSSVLQDALMDKLNVK